MIKLLNPKIVRQGARAPGVTNPAPIRSKSYDLNDLTNCDACMDGRALREVTRVRQIVNIAQARLQVEQIESCLRRVLQNVCGFCVECGNEIGPQRLAAIPDAALCVKCQAKLDETRSN